MKHPPAFETTTKLVARALGTSAEALLTGLKKASHADLSAVVEFRHNNFGEQIRWDDAAYLQWRYRLGRSDCGLGDLWVLYGPNRLLGMIGAEDMVCWHAGHRWIGARTMDILVDESARQSGLGVWLNQAMFRGADFTLAIGANENSAGTVNRLFLPLPVRQECVQPINIRHYVQRRFGRGSAAVVAITLGNLALRGWRRISTLASTKQIQMRPITRFDDSSTILTDPGRPDQVQIERSATFLNRRLFDNPRARYAVTGAYRADRCIGHVAWRVATREDGQTWLHIIDWQIRGDDRDVTLRALLGFTGCQAENAACSFVMLTLQSQDQRSVFTRAGYWTRKGAGQKIVGIHANDPALLATLKAAHWSLTDLSEDIDGY